MSKKQRPLKKQRASGLQSRIEREVVDRPWTPFEHGNTPLDPQTIEHLEHFLTGVNNIPPLEETSLLTPESAREALAKINAVYDEIQSKIRTADALRKLVLSQRK